jgi:hypothetical protein
MPESVLRTCRSRLIALVHAVFFENLSSLKTEFLIEGWQTADRVRRPTCIPIHRLRPGLICVNKRLRDGMASYRLKRFGAAAVLLGLFVWASLSFQSTFRNTAEEDGGTDIHSYWYAGIFVRQGIDPYAAYFDNVRPQAPVQHLDGISTAESLDHYAALLTNVPANTAPIVLLLTGLSFFTWQTAKTIWLLCNLGMMLSIPWLLWRFIKPSGLHSAPAVKLVLALAFYGFLATRNSIGNGQTTIFVIFLMFLSLALIDKKLNLIGGLVLGVALSKYSVALPVFLLLLYRRDFRTAAVALGVQIVGAVVLGLICGITPGGLINDYARMMVYHSELEGIHLAAYLPAGIIYSIVGALLVVVPVAIRLWPVFTAQTIQTMQRRRLLEVHLLAAFMLGALLAVYHKNYDVSMTIAAIALLILVTQNPDVWRLTAAQTSLVTVVCIAAVMILSTPGESVTGFLPASLSTLWLDLLRPIATSTIVVLLATSLWLTRRSVQREYADQHIQPTTSPLYERA